MGFELLLQEDLFTPLNRIVENTEPLDIQNINLLWWSFFIAIFSLLAGTIAAWYSYKGYKFQRISAMHLEALVPGHMSYYEVVGTLLDNILYIESIYFGKQSYKTYPIKLAFSTSKMPSDLIHLENYEKDKACYDEAFKLYIAWQNYNNIIDLLIEYSETLNDIEKVTSLAQFVIDLTKTEIFIVQKFEKYLFENKYIIEKTATNEKISWYLFDRFLESINTISNNKIENMDTSRTNLTKETKHQYIYNSYIPNNFNIDLYLINEHANRLSDLGDDYSSFYDFEPSDMLKSIKEGKFNFLGEMITLPKGESIADIDFSDFKSCYYNYIEPILIGYKRQEFSNFLK